jgi:hypothetical protein
MIAGMSPPAISVRLTAFVLAIALLTGFSPFMTEANDLSRGQPRAAVSFATGPESNAFDGDRFVRCASDSAANADFFFSIKRFVVASSQLTDLIHRLRQSGPQQRRPGRLCLARGLWFRSKLARERLHHRIAQSRKEKKHGRYAHLVQDRNLRDGRSHCLIRRVGHRAISDAIVTRPSGSRFDVQGSRFPIRNRSSSSADSFLER